MNLKNQKKVNEVIKKIKVWNGNIPKWIETLTPKEIYIVAFENGYNCKLAEVQAKLNKFTPTFIFKTK